ncbi:MAG: DUF2834 domain-containing protein [Pseudomonadota bacterium]
MLKYVYLALALIGTVLPWFYFASWFMEFGWDLGAMVDDWNRTDAGTGLVYDLTVAWAALLIAVCVDVWRSRDWRRLVCLPLSITVGVSCALPLWLYFRETRAV